MYMDITIHKDSQSVRFVSWWTKSSSGCIAGRRLPIFFPFLLIQSLSLWPAVAETELPYCLPGPPCQTQMKWRFLEEARRKAKETTVLMDFSPRADLLWCSDESESAQVLYHLSASFISSLQEHDLWQSLVSPQIHSSKLEYDLANFIYNLHSPNPLLTPPTCTDSSMVYHRAGKLTVAIGDQSKLY